MDTRVPYVFTASLTFSQFHTGIRRFAIQRGHRHYFSFMVAQFGQVPCICVWRQRPRLTGHLQTKNPHQFRERAKSCRNLIRLFPRAHYVEYHLLNLVRTRTRCGEDSLTFEGQRQRWQAGVHVCIESAFAESSSIRKLSALSDC